MLGANELPGSAGRMVNQSMYISGIIMNENQAQSGDDMVSSSQKKTEGDTRKSIEAEIQEMERYKWYLGVQLQHDPLQDRSLNEIYCEWIAKYAADFRKFWEKKGHEDQ